MSNQNEIKPTAPVEGIDAGFDFWRAPQTAPQNTIVLVAWGSKAIGPMAYDIGEIRRGEWRTDAGQAIETQGYSVCAWMPLPALPNHVLIEDLDEESKKNQGNWAKRLGRIKEKFL